jgi:hypothetical protein
MDEGLRTGIVRKKISPSVDGTSTNATCNFTVSGDTWGDATNAHGKGEGYSEWDEDDLSTEEIKKWIIKQNRLRNVAVSRSTSVEHENDFHEKLRKLAEQLQKIKLAVLSEEIRPSVIRRSEVFTSCPKAHSPKVSHESTEDTQSFTAFDSTAPVQSRLN